MKVKEGCSELEGAIRALSRNRLDKNAWDALYRALWPSACLIARSYLGPLADEAEDAAQEVFIKLAKYCPFENLNERTLRAYLSVACRNESINRLKGRRKLISSALFPEDLPCPDGRVGAAVDFEEVLQMLLQPFEPTDQEIIRLLARGNSLKSIASRTGLSYTAAGVRLHRIRKRIRSFM